MIAVVLREVDGEPLLEYVNETVPFLLIEDRQVSLSLLTTLIGGLISLMVFSFSMVMVLLSNATSNLTPRLLPSLVGSRRHQVVLGFYLGTILYNIIIAMGFGLATGDKASPSVAVAFAIVFGIICLALFVSFIHGVSKSIQVGVVLDEVHERTIAAITGLVERNQAYTLSEAPDYSLWTPLYAPTSGHFQSIDDSTICRTALKHRTRIVIPTRRGNYVLKGQVIAYAEPAHLPDDINDEFSANWVFSRTERAEEYFAHGIERITEVALKGLSPGINDPGTALTSLDYLKHIFVMALATGNWEVIGKKEQALVWLYVTPWEELVRKHLTAIYSYGKADQQVVARLREVVEALSIYVKDDHAEQLNLLRHLKQEFEYKPDT